MSREQHIPTHTPLQDSYEFISYEIIMNSKVDLITNKMDRTTVGRYVTGIRGTCDWDDAGNFCSYEECHPSGKWDFNRMVWSIRYDNNVERSKPFGFHVNTMKELKRMWGDGTRHRMEYHVVAFYHPELTVSAPESEVYYLSVRNDLTNHTGWDWKWNSATETDRVHCAEMVRYLWTHLH
ncbi:hypothetical protein BDV38DRAFT_285291 [Aspergillus pseudotamarii]|uniref:Uncharacterized protein n=1 Tax=Aspergillus pseudotamarii TaxID=132259 RepID=A0A5N6SMI5_ASPPS|nr:uncharacterized protein BDV38DRAFT_285291 [Aspergillus pseudotamarii]KAE8135089.1 hypothetical protein BDV38DRAFT_285291 [Aspergillus pseudotamarii]